MGSQEVTEQNEKSLEDIDELIDTEQKINRALSENLTDNLKTGQVTDISLDEGVISLYYRCGGVFWLSEFDLYSKTDRDKFETFLNRHGIQTANLADIIGKKVSIIERRNSQGLVISGNSHRGLKNAMEDPKLKYQPQSTNFIYNPRRSVGASLFATVILSFIFALFSAQFITTFLVSIILLSMVAFLFGAAISEFYPNTPSVKTKRSSVAREEL